MSELKWFSSETKYLNNNSLELSPSWEATSLSATQEFPNI
jgi:hypothetical protein